MADPAQSRPPRPRGRALPALLVAAGVAAVALAIVLVVGLRGGPDGASGADPPAQSPRARDAAVPRARADRFSGERALRLVELQLRAGNRPAGSAALARLRPSLVRRLSRGTTEAVPGHPGLRNVVGRIPGRSPAVVIGAHYDTEAEPRDFVGANDGAAGPAVVLEAARALAAQRRPAGAREVRFVLFDGEEEPPGTAEEDFERVALRGSKAYAARHADDVGAFTLLDYVGNRGLRLPREGASTPALWARWRAAARSVGTDRLYAGEAGVQIIDDHVPFLRRGVPSIDLIDWTYAHKDTNRDTVDKLSRDALDAVGETAVAWLAAERRRRA